MVDTAEVWFGMRLLAGGVVVLVVVLMLNAGAEWWARRLRRAEPKLKGRQQVRAAFRAEAGRQLAVSPAPRSVRRRAATELRKRSQGELASRPETVGATVRSGRTSSTTFEPLHGKPVLAYRGPDGKEAR